jgi:HSP20 family molecular chaperone IbpA
MDVLESPKSFVVSLELPGVPLEGVRVELREGRCVRISRPKSLFSSEWGQGETVCAESLVGER